MLAQTPALEALDSGMNFLKTSLAYYPVGRPDVVYTSNIKDLTIPLVSSGVGHNSGSTQQPLDSTHTAGTDRSFPLSGGVALGQQGSSTLGTHGTSGTSGLGTSERELPVGDRHGREGLAGAAAAATAGTAAAVHGHHDDNRNTQADTLAHT